MGMTYEELIKVSNGRIEDLDEILEMFSPADAGRRFYNKIFAMYERFCNTGNIGIFEKIVDGLYTITGYRI